MELCLFILVWLQALLNHSIHQWYYKGQHSLQKKDLLLFDRKGNLIKNCWVSMTSGDVAILLGVRYRVTRWEIHMYLVIFSQFVLCLCPRVDLDIKCSFHRLGWFCTQASTLHKQQNWRMAESSEGEGHLDLSQRLSAKRRRRCLKRPQISSDSDGEERKTGPLKKQLDGSTKETEEDVDCGSEITKTSCFPQSQTPRTSERLRRKRSTSFSLPSREEVLDAISPGARLSSQKKIKTLRPRKLVNNFLREWVIYY